MRRTNIAYAVLKSHPGIIGHYDPDQNGGLQKQLSGDTVSSSLKLYDKSTTPVNIYFKTV